MKLMSYVVGSDHDSFEVNYLYLDGYDFGDRIIEGALFQLSIRDGQLFATCHDAKGLDAQYWEKKCVKYALTPYCVLSVSPNLDDDLGFIQQEPEKEIK